MGWPRRNDKCRLYHEIKDDSYCLVIVENGLSNGGRYEAIANVIAGSKPTLCSTQCAPEFLRNCCRRVSWADLPEVWQNAFKKIMSQWDETDPAKIRGFHRV